MSGLNSGQGAAVFLHVGLYSVTYRLRGGYFLLSNLIISAGYFSEIVYGFQSLKSLS